MEKQEDIEIGKSLTWQDIKELVNSLNEEQLQQEVRWWGEESGGSVSDANILNEDYLSDGVSYAPKSEMLPDDIDEDEPIFPKGTVMLWIL